MAYTGTRKLCTTELFEININKMKVRDSFIGVKQLGLDFTDFTMPCYVEGVKVGYGTRYFFRCGRCNTRVTKLYTVPKPTEKHTTGCRYCLELNYISQQATKTDLAYEYHLMKRYGRMLDPNYQLVDFTTPCPWKPKHMHYKTYEKIRNKYEKASHSAHKKFSAMIGPTIERIRKQLYGKPSP